MRQVVLDTETTGLEIEAGHRIIEIGCVEIVGRKLTRRHYHQYINPERAIDDGALEVHGITSQFLSDKPVFAEVWDSFLEFVDGSELIIHNAAFDMKFLNAELDWCAKPQLPWEQAIDTLDMARRKFPGAQNTLDGLSRRFGINIERDLHGALLDSQILAAVYLELIGGRQPDFALGIVGGTDTTNVVAGSGWKPQPRPKTLPPRTTEAEKENHQKFIETLGPDALWLNS